MQLENKSPISCSFWCWHWYFLLHVRFRHWPEWKTERLFKILTEHSCGSEHSGTFSSAQSQQQVSHRHYWTKLHAYLLYIVHCTSVWPITPHPNIITLKTVWGFVLYKCLCCVCNEDYSLRFVRKLKLCSVLWSWCEQTRRREEYWFRLWTKGECDDNLEQTQTHWDQNISLHTAQSSYCTIYSRRALLNRLCVSRPVLPCCMQLRGSVNWPTKSFLDVLS